MADEAIQGIKDIVYPFLPYLYTGIAIIAGTSLIIGIIAILFKKKH